MDSRGRNVHNFALVDRLRKRARSSKTAQRAQKNVFSKLDELSKSPSLITLNRYPSGKEKTFQYDLELNENPPFNRDRYSPINGPKSRFSDGEVLIIQWNKTDFLTRNGVRRGLSDMRECKWLN